jgi:UDP-glucose 4-epimerase
MREAGYAGDADFDAPDKGPARDGDLRRSCLDCGKAERLLGWRALQDLKTGLKNTIEWFLEAKSADRS